MSSASKRPCLRDNFAFREGSQNGTVEEGDDKNQTPNGKYFAVRPEDSQVQMRVQHKGKAIGRFTHRISPTEKLRLVKANFLVELITHYGGRKRTKGGREFQDMDLRSLGEVFQKLPELPETLVSFLNEYTPAKKADPVPQMYKDFIFETWEKYMDEVLSLYKKRVQSTTSVHVVLDSCTDEMEIGEREAQLHEKNKTCTNHDTISKDIEVPWQEHIDKCLSVTPPISCEDVNRIIPEVRDVEEENHLAFFRPDEMEIGEREAEFSRQTISQHSEIVENGDLLQWSNNRIMKLEKIVADLQAQLHEKNKTCTNHDTINKDIEVPLLEHIDKCLSVVRPISREDANSVLPEVRDVEEEYLLAPLRTDETEKILADKQAQRNTASLSVVPPITREDYYRVSPEVPDGEEEDWLAVFEYDKYNNQTWNST